MKWTNYLSILSLALVIIVGGSVWICGKCTLQRAYDGGNIIQTGLHEKDVPAVIEVDKPISAFKANYVGSDTINGAIFDVRTHNARGRISLAESSKIDDYPSKHSQFSILHNGVRPGWSLVTNGDNVTFNLRDWTGKYEELSDSTEGKVGVGTWEPTAKVDVNGATGYNQLRMRKSYTPRGPHDFNGEQGDIAWDNKYIYIKTASSPFHDPLLHQWKRAQLGW